MVGDLHLIQSRNRVGSGGLGDGQLALIAGVGILVRDCIIVRCDGQLAYCRIISNLYGFVAILIVTIVGKLALGGMGWGKLTAFKLGFENQPVAHSSHLWNFLGMVLAGWGSVLLGGCPLRQLILAGEGNGDSAVTVFGMIAGAAISHNFGMAGNPDANGVVGGISLTGKVFVLCAFVILLAISLVNLPKAKQNA